MTTGLSEGRPGQAHPWDDEALAQSGELFPGSLVVEGEEDLSQWETGIKGPRQAFEGRLGVIEGRQYIRSEDLD